MSRYRTGVSSVRLTTSRRAARLHALAQGARRPRPRSTRRTSSSSRRRTSSSSPELIIGRDADEPDLRARAGRQPPARAHLRTTDARWMLQRSRQPQRHDGRRRVRHARSSSSRTTRSASATRSSSSSRPAPSSYVAYRIDGARRRRAQGASSFTELVGGSQIDHIAADIERIAPTELSVRRPRRDRHRQGGRRARHPPRLRAQGLVPGHQLRGHPAQPPRERALRLPARRVLRRRPRQARPHQARRRRHALPRRDRRHAARRAGQAAARAPVARGLPARRDDARARRHPRRLRDAPRSLRSS